MVTELDETPLEMAQRHVAVAVAAASVADMREHLNRLQVEYDAQ